MKNLIEHYRQEVIEDIFKLQSVQKVWPIWKNLIQKKLTNLNPENIFNLGDELRDIMFSTNKGRNQSSQSAGGNAWEFFVCWYLNLCLVGSKSVVVKFKKKFIPEVIKDAIAVNYSNFTTNTESDLMAITFSDKINLKEESFNLKKLNSYIDENLSDISIFNIQCKTNWNDNAQIPMLWDIVYQAKGFESDYISVGNNNRKLSHFKKFRYCFVTVPTQKKPEEKFKNTSVCVKRVQNISGGNYWGMKTKDGVARSIKELLTRNLDEGNNNGSLRKDLEESLTDKSNFKYFDII